MTFRYIRNGIPMTCDGHTRSRDHYLNSVCVGCGAFLGAMNDDERPFVAGVRSGQVRLIPPEKKDGWYSEGEPRQCLIVEYDTTPGCNFGAWRPIRKDGSLGDTVKGYCGAQWPVVPALVVETRHTVFVEGIAGPVVHVEERW